MEPDLVGRVGRIYAAIDAVEEHDPQRLKAEVIQTDTIRGVFQDFRSGLTDEELSNSAYTLIYNIAHLRDHLRKWAALNRSEETGVDRAIDQSPALKIIIDLSNSDKHGYPPRNGGRSGRSPRLIRINRVMQLRTRAQKGSTIALTIGPGGVPRFSGDGTAKAVITGQVVDKDGNPIGDLYDIASKAVEAWEDLLVGFGIGPGTKRT